MSVAVDPVSEHAVEPDHGTSRADRGMDVALLGMLLFIASEIMFFAALFGVYFNVRATSNPWPPEGTEFISWQGSGLLGLGISVLITIILVSSSFTMQWATGRIRAGDRTGMNRGLAVTLLLGLLFLGLMMYEYYTLVSHEDFGINTGVYGSLFYVMTGFHGAHVLGGIIGIAVVLARGLRGQFSAKHHVAVEAVHYYWHFVDVVWIFLFLTIYVLR
jgi:cytochrome c oxidase subunit 3